MYTDPIADMLTRIRNANKERHIRVDIPASKLKLEIAKIFYHEGFIRGYRLVKGVRKLDTLRIYLKYGPNRERVIANLKRISKPSRRLHVSKEKIPKALGGLGITILSTSRGLMTDSLARRLKIGGEVICQVW